MIFIVCMCSDVLVCDACDIFRDTVIVGSIKDGIRVTNSCTIRFENVSDICIGDCHNKCPGIEVVPDVTLTIDVASRGNVNVYGGYYFDNGNEYDCAGIHVPSKAMLLVDNSGRGKLIIHPFDRGAGIGGNGVLFESFESNVNCQNAGKIVIKNGQVLIQNPVNYSGFGKGAGDEPRRTFGWRIRDKGRGRHICP